MTTYYIYDEYTDEKLGEVEAMNIQQAEIKAEYMFLEHTTYALTTDENEPFA